MKIIKPEVKEIVQEDLFKQIELCGRTCYKSEDRICEGSAEKFVNMLRNHAHGAMLEHGTVYLAIPDFNERDSEGKRLEAKVIHLLRNKYTKYKIGESGTTYVTTNYRVIVENDFEDLMNKYQTEYTPNFYRRRTFRITCNRGVTHEFVRHRVFSFAMESQRYVNYFKDKFGKEIKVIKPLYFEEGSDLYAVWKASCERDEEDYFKLIELGATPEKAREVLPNSCAAELIMTGFEEDWQHFFNLRCASDAHPQAQEVANMIKEVF